MKERPIIFSAPMVRAILSEQKTVTRRVMGSQPTMIVCGDPRVPDKSKSPSSFGFEGMSPVYPTKSAVCPYGKPGDRLWVRETFQLEDTSDYAGDPAIEPALGPVSKDDGALLIPRYRASEPDVQLMVAPGDDDDVGMRWKPSIFMPRWASRITLDVTGVGVERVQDISEEQARAEGVPGDLLHAAAGFYPLAFAKLWESINGPESWHSNPWVWCVSFKRVTP